MIDEGARMRDPRLDRIVLGIVGLTESRFVDGIDRVAGIGETLDLVAPFDGDAGPGELAVQQQQDRTAARHANNAF